MATPRKKTTPAERSETTAPLAAIREAGRTTAARTATAGLVEAALSDAGASWERVSHRAFELWQEAGQPQGRDLEHWLQAEAELRGKASRGGR
jgi:uncharacterized protein YukE